METILILTALAVLVVSALLVGVMMAHGRRPELRMQREEDLAADGEEALLRSLEPPRESPIDRTAPVLDIEPEPRRLPPRREDRS